MARGRNTEESTPAEQPNLFVVINTDTEDFLGAYPNEDKAIARAKDYVDNDTPEVVINYKVFFAWIWSSTATYVLNCLGPRCTSR